MAWSCRRHLAACCNLPHPPSPHAIHSNPPRTPPLTTTSHRHVHPKPSPSPSPHPPTCHPPALPAQALNTLKQQLSELTARNEALSGRLSSTAKELAGFEGELAACGGQSSSAHRTLRKLQEASSDV
jgi:hypothetical protein